MNRRGAVLIALALLAGLSMPAAVQVAPARAATTQATVVVQLPDGSTRTRTIAVSDSMSGVDALSVAGFTPVTYGSGALGTAVCQILTFGCPADSSCLTCGGQAYWSYWRAPAGTDSFRYSPVGAGATKVRVGDVEGWRWGNGNDPPPFPHVASPPPTTAPISPPPATSPAPAVSTPPGASPHAGGASVTTAPPDGGDANGPGPEARPSGEQSPTTTATPGSTAARGGDSTKASKSAAHSDGAAASSNTTSDDGALAVASTPGKSSGGSWLGIALFAVLAAVLVGWLVVARRRRALPTAR